MDAWQRIKFWRREDWQTGSLVLCARRRDAPRCPTYAAAVRLPRELREDILALRGGRTYRRYINTIKSAMTDALMDESRVHGFYVREGEEVRVWRIERLRLPSLENLPDLRRHKGALLRAA